MKIYFLLGLLAIVMLLAGCGTYTTTPRTAGNENYRTGTQGLYMTYMLYSPPDRVFDDEDLDVRVQVRNMGATDLKGSGNRLYLSGFDTTLITGIPTTGIPIPDMMGKSFFSIQGDLQNLEFKGQVRDLKSRGIDVYPITLLVTACYQYQTIADPVVCVDPDPYTTTVQNKVCSFLSTPYPVGSQGAPVAVTSVQLEAAKGKTRFKIFIQNVASGTTLKDGSDTLARCSPYDFTNIDYNDVDYVNVQEVMLGDQSILDTCKPLENGYLRLQTSGSGYLVCEADGLSGSAYQTPLRVVLNYNYRDKISKSIRIVQTP